MPYSISKSGTSLDSFLTQETEVSRFKKFKKPKKEIQLENPSKSEIITLSNLRERAF